MSNQSSIRPAIEISILQLTESGDQWPRLNSSQRVVLFVGVPGPNELKPISEGTDVIVILSASEPGEESDGDALYDAVVMACLLYKPHAIFTHHGPATLIALHRPTKETPLYHAPIMAQWKNDLGEHVLYGSVSKFAVPPIENDPKI